MPDPRDPTVSLPPADPALTRTAPGLTTPGETVPGTDVPLPPDLANHPRYRIIRPLGQGGMGSVYLAEHRIMGRQVALKVIHPRYTASATAVERFRREVRAAAKLNHPNIVAAFDAEQAGATNFLVMEYVEGMTLAEYVHQTGPLPVREACSYAQQAARALQYAHEKGMVHRDIKPDNLMRSASGEVRVLDFGLARLAEASDVAAAGPVAADPTLTAAGSVMGTPDYMAPEQGKDSSSADGRSDIYALGATLFHLITGTVPFPGGTAVEKLTRHEQEPPPPLGAVREGVPPGLEKLVARMLAKRPQDRPQTPAEVARMLRAYCRPSRTWWWVGGAVALLLLAVVATAFYWYYAVWPGRGEVAIDPTPPGRPFIVSGLTSEGEKFHQQFVTGEHRVLSLPPGRYTLSWPGGSDNSFFVPSQVSVERGTSTRVAIEYRPAPPPKR
jgi:tRNA A-37 threonylcarbamoyl transferase component Bud32